MEKNEKQTKRKVLKYENHTYNNKKEDKEMTRKKKENKTLIGVIGVLLTIFGIMGTIPVLQNRQYLILILTAIAVIAGVILVAWSVSD